MNTETEQMQKHEEEPDNIMDMMFAVEDAAISYLKEFEDCDVWEQTNLVNYVLDRAEEMGLIKQLDPSTGKQLPN